MLKVMTIRYKYTLAEMKTQGTVFMLFLISSGNFLQMRSGLNQVIKDTAISYECFQAELQIQGTRFIREAVRLENFQLNSSLNQKIKETATSYEYLSRV
jgi:hypothetical protein